MQHRITSAYHPQTNGLTERFNQALSRCLAKTVNDNQDNWDEKINRASRQASIKHSPYFMLFQVEMRLPIQWATAQSVWRKNPGGSYRASFEEPWRSVHHSWSQHQVSTRQQKRDVWQKTPASQHTYCGHEGFAREYCSKAEEGRKIGLKMARSILHQPRFW